MRFWAIHFVLGLLLFSSLGLELLIVENGDTKPMPSVVQAKAGTTFSLFCKSESCKNNCESLSWRRRRKGTGSSLETSPILGSHWLNFTNAVLDDQGFYECVDTEHKTGKVMYLVVRKPGFEKESIEIIKKDLVLIRKKRDVYLVNRTNTFDLYNPYVSQYASPDFNDEDWYRNMKEVRDEIEQFNKEYFDSINYNDYNTNYQNNYGTNTFNTDYHPTGSSKNTPKNGVFWGIAGVVLISVIIYAIIRCCNDNTNTFNTTRETVSRPSPTSNCRHAVCRQYREHYPTVNCLYSTPGSPFTTMPANDTTLPSSPLLEVPRATSLRNDRDEPPTYIESTGNSAASSMTNLNEVGQNGRGKDAVDACALPPTYEEAVYNIALGPRDPPGGNGGGRSSHDTGGGGR